MVDISPSTLLTTCNSNQPEYYETLSREELIEKIRKLECHVLQLRNVISKGGDGKFSDAKGKRKRGEDGNDNDEEDTSSTSNGRKAKKPRPFDFSLHQTRHVALKFLYLGWDYQGFACQEDTNETIEAHLFKALTMTRLVEDRAKSNYHRCGRTDKGVSAFQQVISIDLRSKVVDGQETIDYCYMLNRVLPKEIRILGWAPVRSDFSARFDCNQRTYKYFFPRGDLDISKMQTAANYLIGEHDFRNLCKLDGDKSTIRRIISADIVTPPSSGREQLSLDICKLLIVGKSFVWHQIRCIASVLLLVGKGLEDPGVVLELLNVEKHPRKPQYSMAVDYPLVLYDVQYPETEGIVWNYSNNSLKYVLSDLQTIWAEHSIKSAMVREMIVDVDGIFTEPELPNEHVNCLLMGTKRRQYQKLLSRPVCGP